MRLVDANGAGSFGFFMDGGNDVKKVVLFGVGFRAVLTGKFGEAGSPAEEVLGVFQIAAGQVGGRDFAVDGIKVADENLAGGLDVSENGSDLSEIEKIEVKVVTRQKPFELLEIFGDEVGLLLEVKTMEMIDEGEEGEAVILNVVKWDKVGGLFEKLTLGGGKVGEIFPEGVDEPLGHIGLR